MPSADFAAAALGNAPAGERFDYLINHLHDHLGARCAHDDVSLLMTRCISTEAQP